MADVHEVYVDKRRSRAGPVIVLTLIVLLLLGVVVAMVMNVHGSISWPAGEMKFGFWPQATSAAPTQVATDDVTEVIPESDVQPVDEASQDPPPSEAQQQAPPVESNTASGAEQTPPPQ